MNTAQEIYNYIDGLGGQPFTTASLTIFAHEANIRKILSRLVQAREVTRLRRGLFVRTKKLPYMQGASLPSPQEILEVIAKKSGEVFTVSGAEAAQLLHLSTQAPLRSVFYTTGTSRKVKVGNLMITLKHVSPRKLVKPGTMICLVINALWYLGRDQIAPEIITKIYEQLKPEDWVDLKAHSSRMPAWMAQAILAYTPLEHKNGT